jgi:hypothetical protein
MSNVHPARHACLTATEHSDSIASSQQRGRQGATDETTSASHENASHIAEFTLNLVRAPDRTDLARGLNGSTS